MWESSWTWGCSWSLYHDLFLFRTGFQVLVVAGSVISCVQAIRLLFCFYGFCKYSSYPMFDMGYGLSNIEIDDVTLCSHNLRSDEIRSSFRTLFWCSSFPTLSFCWVDRCKFGGRWFFRLFFIFAPVKMLLNFSWAVNVVSIVCFLSGTVHE